MNVGRPSLSPEKMLVFLQEHVYRDGDCLLWAGYTHETAGPRVTWRRQAWIARRLLVTLMGRTLSRNERVYDTCGQARCMNHDHLRVGKHRDAMRQAAKEGAFLSGARRSLMAAIGRAGKARLGIHDAPTVLQLRASGVTYRQIGERYGVTPSAVGHAIAAWRRVGITEWRPLA